jgi:multidrug resistance efflux pump
LIVGVLALLAYLLVPGYYFASADALVQGDLVPVTSLFRVRVDRLMVGCDDRVTAGEQVAVVSNFIVQANYDQQYQQSISQLDLSQIALDEGVSAARTDEAADLAKYQAAEIEAKRAHDDFASYDAAYKQGAIPRIEWQSKRQTWLGDVALAEGAKQIWIHAQQHVTRVSSDNQTRVAQDTQASQRVQALAKRVSSEALRAPVSGYVVNCLQRPQNVIEPGSPLFDIFAPDRAYVLAYYDPGSIERVHLGEDADVFVAGLKKPIKGRVFSIYPDLVKLPTQLTRFFWQHVQWSEYRPVRIALDHVPPEVRAQLYYDAQTRVRIRIPRAWHPFGYGEPNGTQ